MLGSDRLIKHSGAKLVISLGLDYPKLLRIAIIKKSLEVSRVFCSCLSVVL